MQWQDAAPWVLMPVMGALIGWMTNRIAIRSLFRPYQPVRLPVVGWKYQGVLPRRQRELAESVGRIVEEHLFSRREIGLELSRPQVVADVASAAAQAVEEAFRRRLALLPESIWSLVHGWLSKTVQEEISRFVGQGLPILVSDLAQQVDIAGRVESRLAHYDLSELEDLVYRLAGRELKHIEWLGAVLGGVIGLLQAVIVSLIA